MPGSKRPRTPAVDAVGASADATSLACRALEELSRFLADDRARAPGPASPPGSLQAAADNCAHAVIVSDDNARIMLVNSLAARLTGFSMRELLTLTVWDMTHVSSQMDFDVLWKAFLRAGRQRGAYTLRHKSGAPIEVAYCAQAHVSPHRHVSILIPVTS